MRGSASIGPKRRGAVGAVALASAMGLREWPRPGAGASPLGLRFDLSHAIWQDRRGGRGRQTAVPTRKEPNIAKKPNLIVILIDDLRFDETSASGHPYMKTPHIDRLAREGAMFENAFHRLDNYHIALQALGYETAHVGKWHMGNDSSPRPGHDHWVSFKGQGRLVDPILWENGGEHQVEGYIYELQNLAFDPACAKVREAMRKELRKLTAEALGI